VISRRRRALAQYLLSKLSRLLEAASGRHQYPSACMQLMTVHIAMLHRQDDTSECTCRCYQVANLHSLFNHKMIQLVPFVCTLLLSSFAGTAGASAGAQPQSHHRDIAVGKHMFATDAAVEQSPSAVLLLIMM
jgi:hypothetical protein